MKKKIYFVFFLLLEGVRGKITVYIKIRFLVVEQPNFLLLSNAKLVLLQIDFKKVFFCNSPGFDYFLIFNF